ncbi:MAG TPA: multiheme c-type cytochrome, partial [Oligoflexia bacterium]|nr:multiheme c-type cytochrome [Oligoflexia bacterium]
SNPMDQLLLRSKKRIAELNAESDAEIFGDAVPAKNKHVRAEKKVRNTTTPGQVLQTFAQCAQCHSKQHEFVSKTRHSSAYLTLMKVGQNRNLECLQCHTLGQGMPSGYSHVDRLVIGTDGSQLNVEKFASELPQMSVAELRKVKRALINVQCESCHSVAPTHARKSGGTNISPKPGAATCLACHTSDRAPGWYRDGKLDQKLFAEKLESVSCPR